MLFRFRARVRMQMLPLNEADRIRVPQRCESRVCDEEIDRHRMRKTSTE
jgi:hypothetical protein